MLEEETILKKVGKKLLEILKSALKEAEIETYHHVVLSRWGEIHDVEKLTEELERDFTFIKILLPERKAESPMSELKGSMPEIEFKADTLYALVAPRRAVLFQKERKPFTGKDQELRKRILELYPFKIRLPFFGKEPEFEVEEPQKIPVEEVRKGKETRGKKKKANEGVKRS